MPPNWRTSLYQLKELVSLILPQGKREAMIFFGFFIFYTSYSLLFLFNTSVVDTIDGGLDMYFYFDNSLYFHYGGNRGCDSHPLLRYFLSPIIYISDLLSGINYKYKGAFLILIFTSFVCLSNVYVYRYLKKIVELKEFISLLLTVSFGCFSTNMILSFTPESYPIALCILTFIAYFYSYCIKNNHRVEFSTFFLISLVTAGSTITNYAKSAMFYLFTPKKWSVKFTQAVVVGVLMLLMMIGIVVRAEYDFIERMEWRISYTDNPNSTQPVWLVAISNFLGSPILLAPVIKHQVYGNMAIHIDMYKHIWQYVWLLLLGIGMVSSIIFNRANKLLLALLAVWSIDLFLHLIVGYGVREGGVLYGGNWVYVVPLFLGWLYYKLSEKKQIVLTVILSIMFVAMLVNNLHGLFVMYEKAQILYPPIFP